MLGMPRKEMAEGDEVSKFPDLTGDGKVTQADILKGSWSIPRRWTLLKKRNRQRLRRTSIP